MRLLTSAMAGSAILLASGAALATGISLPGGNVKFSLSAAVTASTTGYPPLAAGLLHRAQ